MTSVLIRADSGEHLGTGHVMRMIALAQACQRRNVLATIVTIDSPVKIVERIRLEGIAVSTQVDITLGGDKDLEITIQLAEAAGAQWVVLDGYHFNQSYQCRLRESGFKVLAVDDYGHCETWQADIVLNQNMGAERWSNRHSTNASTKWLLGSDFVLIRTEFQDSIAKSRRPNQPPQKILVTLGGVDPDNFTAAVIQLLDDYRTRSLEVRVLVGGASPHLENLTCMASQSFHKIEIISNTTQMPEMYSWADAVISAGGSTCWEWLAHGRLGAVVTIAENQVPIVNELSSRALAVSLGWGGDLLNGSPGKLLRDLLDGRLEMSNESKTVPVIDGRGADRVASVFVRSLRVVILSDPQSWIGPYILELADKLRQQGHVVNLLDDHSSLTERGDVLLMLSYWRLVPNNYLRRFCHAVVVHESDVPIGRGWSPVSWQVLEGAVRIPVCLFEAVGDVDAGPVYLRNEMQLAGNELIDEIRKEQGKATIELCVQFMANYPFNLVDKKVQIGDPTYYRRRKPEDSRLDIDKSLRDQFNLLRIVDNDAYPAFFEMEGRRYKLTIEVQ